MTEELNRVRSSLTQQLNNIVIHLKLMLRTHRPICRRDVFPLEFREPLLSNLLTRYNRVRQVNRFVCFKTY